MVIANILINNKKVLGVIKENRLYPFSNFGIMEENLEEVIKKYSIQDLNKLVTNFNVELSISLEQAKYLAPIEHPSQDVLCLGLNYSEHIKESMRFKKEEFKPVNEPVYFSKRVAQAIGHKEYIDGHFNIVTELDYECELGVIIGKDAYHISKDKANDYIFGYTIINDVSARNVQSAHKQWHFGKSLDTFCPMGPVVVTRDEINPSNLNIKSYVNNELRQNSNTSNFIFPIDYVIENLTEGMTLKAGSIISTGTPSGVGMGFVPPRFLHPGDVVSCEIEGIGTLENLIK